MNSWQGTWTDVYALGAITYRTLTGEIPPAAIDRIYGDDLLDSQVIGPQMTESAVNAINHALAVEIEDRTQTAEAFIAELLATDGSNTAVYTAPVPRRSYETPEDSVRIDTAKAIGKFLSRSGKSDSESKVTISLADEDFAKKLEEVASDSAGK